MVYTGSSFLLDMALYPVLPAELDDWNTSIRRFGSFAIWVFYGRWVWKKLTSPKSASIDEGNELETAVPQTSEEGTLLDSTNSQVSKEGSGETEEHTEAKIEKVKPRVGFAGKKIILSTIGVLIILWIALFVSGRHILVWEETYTREDCLGDGKSKLTLRHPTGERFFIKAPRSFQYMNTSIKLEYAERLVDEWKDQRYKGLKKDERPESLEGKVFQLNCTDLHDTWSCRYFNGRRVTTKHYSLTEYDGCSNLLSF